MFRQILSFRFGSGGTLNDIRAFPLRPGDENRPHAAFRRQVLFEPFNVRFLSGERHTRTSVQAELDHLVTVIEQIIAEISRGLALLFRANGQVKSYD